MSNEILSAIQKFHNVKVLVIGEAILDRYLNGRVSRINREAPVPIVDIENENEYGGGAANTAMNISDLGGQSSFISAVGNDEYGKSLINLLKARGVNTDNVFVSGSRKTLAKQRVNAGTHMFVRFDVGSTSEITKVVEQSILEALHEQYAKHDVVIVSDYGYGIITDRIADSISKLQAKYKKVLVVDSKEVEKFRAAKPTAIKPNYSEVTRLLGLIKQDVPEGRVEQILPFGARILNLTGASLAAVTVDVEGSVLFQKDKNPYRTYTKPVENSKAAGAGDTYTAALALALGSGFDPGSAAEIAAAASTVVVQKEDTATCNQKELLFFFTAQNKHIDSDLQMELLLEEYRRQGKRIVFTNGCFDILHTGHVQYLNGAKELGDVLIVALNTDQSVKRLKGPERPINKLEDRISVLSALSSIDHLVSFPENTPINLLKKIRPDIFVKGGDYTKDTLPEAPVVEGYGGEVRILPFIEGRSTTKIIDRIKETKRK